MKTLTFCRRIVIVGSMILITSCSKDKIQPENSFQEPPPPGPPSTIRLDLVADNWTDHQNNTHSKTFIDVFKSINLQATLDISVFTVYQQTSYRINGPINFLGGVMEAAIVNKDLLITYKYPSHPLPFSLLNIRVVITSQ